MEKPIMSLNEERQHILDLVRSYSARALANGGFSPDETAIPPSGKVLGPEEFVNLVDASLDGWLTTGRFNAAFENKLADYLAVEYALTCNSGSSANLLALTALTSPLLGQSALQPGDEVITAAAGFPTTVNPILQNGLTPVFVDSEIGTYNPSTAVIEAAISPRTRAIMLAHTLGNPFDAASLRDLADRHGLWLIEDCCDALGSTLNGQKVGTFGHIGTLSFYPAHHITMGEGGAVFTVDSQLKRILESLRDWGRDCWCNPGCDNTCGKRYDWQLGELPAGYDHKYVYSHLGYNLKITDMQAAIGLAQLERLDGFIATRKGNFAKLHGLLANLTDFLILPEATEGSDPSWFGFPITLRDDAPFDRVTLLRNLDQHKIGTRLLFAGNLTRQPYMAGRNYRVAGTLDNADQIMKNTFWVGVWPGLGDAELEHIAACLSEFCQPSF
ncbi:lipopolysaccharide biosynthesis protein RfbH [Azonexus hydrophilus]|uniref:Lipopolysaccharide biosynthesis protein RfbH n=2 Tax=Azonexus hydrophilus TaxID=418702 RepID=A0A1R1IE61_9RHOO|nr:lipopolysaccharide biosynthesis protein RfbH [Azonexus hydrophilus]